MGILDIVPVSSEKDVGYGTSFDDWNKAGVLTGDNVRKLFDYAKEHKVRFISLRYPGNWY